MPLEIALAHDLLADALGPDSGLETSEETQAARDVDARLGFEVLCRHKGVLGAMKEECVPYYIAEYVGLQSKVYSIPVHGKGNEQGRGTWPRGSRVSQPRLPRLGVWTPAFA